MVDLLMSTPFCYSSDQPLLGMVRKFNPTFLPKYIKAFANSRETFAKRHHLSTNYRWVGVEVPFIICHRQKGQGKELKVVG